MDAKTSGDSLSSYNCRDSPFLELLTPLSAYEIIKMVLLAPLIPLRLLIAVVTMLIMCGVSKWIIRGNPDPDGALPPDRYAALTSINGALSKVVLLCCGCAVTVRGQQHLRAARDPGSDNPIVCFTHSSYLDAVLLYHLLMPAGVTRASNLRIPLIGTIVAANQCISVPDDRLVAAGQRTGHEGVTELIQRHVKDPRRPLLVIAPEGTCGDGRSLLQFRTGAFVPGAPILPLIIQYGKQHFNPAWTLLDLPFHFFRLLCQGVVPVTATFLPVYTPSPEEVQDPKLFAGNVRSHMSRASGLPMVEQSQLHYRSLIEAGVRINRASTQLSAPPGVLSPDGIADLRQAAERIAARSSAKKRA